MIDIGRVFEGLLFATNRDRALYIGTVTRDRPQWLRDNPSRWQPLRDVHQKAAAPWPRAGSESNTEAMSAGPRSPASPGDAQNDSDNDGAALPERCSPPCQPTLLPAPIKADVPSASTQAEPLPCAAAAASETKEEKTQLGANDGKRGRRDGRRGKKQKGPAETSKSARKLSPELMRIVLDALRECPARFRAAHKAGIHRKTLEYWIRRSKAGDNGYDIEWQGLTLRFHEHCELAIADALDKPLEIAWCEGMGLAFKTDPFLVDLGYQGADAYERDENGKVIVEATGAPNATMLRFLLEWRPPEKWRENPNIDNPRKSGVLVVGDHAKELKNTKDTSASIAVRKWNSRMRKIRGAKASLFENL